MKLSCVKQNLNNKHWSVKRVLHEVYTIDRSCSLAPEKVVPGNTKLEQLGSNHLAAPNTGPVAPVTRMLDGPKLFFVIPLFTCRSLTLKISRVLPHWCANLFLPPHTACARPQVAAPRSMGPLEADANFLTDNQILASSVHAASCRQAPGHRSLRPILAEIENQTGDKQSYR